MPLQFDKDPVRVVLHDWWSELKENKGDRAALRRCREPLEALFVPGYHRLFHNLCNKSDKIIPDRARLPAVAALLSHVESVSGEAFPKQMASPRKGGGVEPRLSELRFRRLIQYRTQDEVFPALRRVVQLLDRNANLYDLAYGVYWWGTHWRGDQIRRDWAYAYYGTLR